MLLRFLLGRRFKPDIALRWADNISLWELYGLRFEEDEGGMKNVLQRINRVLCTRIVAPSLPCLSPTPMHEQLTQEPHSEERIQAAKEPDESALPAMEELAKYAVVCVDQVSMVEPLTNKPTKNRTPYYSKYLKPLQDMLHVKEPEDAEVVVGSVGSISADEDFVDGDSADDTDVAKNVGGSHDQGETINMLDSDEDEEDQYVGEGVI